MSSRMAASSIKNKIKREEIAHKARKTKGQAKLAKRLAQAKAEASDPAAKAKRLAANVPRTLDNTREFDPSSNLTADLSQLTQAEIDADLATDPFADFFSQEQEEGRKGILITTGPKACKTTYEFCEELVGVFPGAEFIRRKRGKGFELGRVASWAANRNYGALCVVNEDMKKPNAITLVHLPDGPTAYFKLTSIELTKQIFGHARATPHHPELVLNNFSTRLGMTVGRLFTTLFPPVPEFQGRQVVTLHCQRDFLFFRRHRYAFRTPEKVKLQEIGPRFTLKLRSLRRGLPAVLNLGAPAKSLELAPADEEDLEEEKPLEPDEGSGNAEKMAELVKPPTTDEFLWLWKPELETTRRTFFL